jgi:ectoine hydrolase
VPHFSEIEYAARIRRVRERMAAQGFDLLVSVDPSNMHYLTGYDGWSFYTPQCVVVPLDGEVLLATRFMDVGGARVTTRLRDEHILGFPDHFVQARGKHPFDWVGAELAARGHDRGTVAVETDAYFHSPRAQAALEAAMPEARFTDSAELVNWVRAIKSEAEIALMRDAGRIAEVVMQTALDTIRPGVRQCDAVAAILAAQARGVDGMGGDYTSFMPMLPTGEGAATPHLTWTDQPFVPGEATIIETGAARLRYHCPLARTMHLGSPPRLLADTAEVVREGLDTALATVRPGVRCEQVEAAWREVITRHGLEKESRIGYSIGIGYPPDWGEHTMSLRPGDQSEIAENMAFHMILGMWMGGWGYEISESFVVTPAGADCLTNLPRTLHVVT